MRPFASRPTFPGVLKENQRVKKKKKKVYLLIRKDFKGTRAGHVGRADNEVSGLRPMAVDKVVRSGVCIGNP